MRLTLLLLLLTLQTGTHAAQLRIIEAGVRGGEKAWRRGPALRNSRTLCPAKLFGGAFSVVCRSTKGKRAREATRANFYVNGRRVKTEYRVPYTIAGDNQDVARAWKDFPRKAVIKCVLNNGDEVAATVRFKCGKEKMGKPKKSVAPRPSMRPARSPKPSKEPEPARSPKPSKEPKPARSPRPSKEPKKEKPASSPKPSKAPSSTPKPSTEPKPSPKPSKEPKPSMKPRPSPGPIGSGPAVCVKIPVRSYKNSLTAGWVVAPEGGLAFKPDNPSKGITDKGVAPLVYEFTALATSRFAFVIDMDTKNNVDFNDVWVEFPAGGWTLMRSDSTQQADGWTKAYHNLDGRAVVAKSVDFNPHDFSTREVLQKGEKYVVKLGGRSNMVTVFSLVLFPCSGDGCRTGSYWNNGVKKCSK